MISRRFCSEFELSEYMMFNLGKYEYVTVIANADITQNLIWALLEDVNIDAIEFDARDYCHEYYTAVYIDRDDDKIYMSVGFAYDRNSNRYLGCPDGLVIVHSDVPTKLFVDLSTNDLFGETEYIVFALECDGVCEDDDYIDFYISNEDIAMLNRILKNM